MRYHDVKPYIFQVSKFCLQLIYLNLLIPIAL